MTQDQTQTIQNIALLNFGGIGDGILFSPVIEAVKTAMPRAHITLFLEGRSRSVEAVLPKVDSVMDVKVQGVWRPWLFFKLLLKLRQKHFDMVISSGSSPFIAWMLFLTGIPYRFGFDSGSMSHKFLSAPAPLDLNCYASKMYYSLANTSIGFLQGTSQTMPNEILPVAREIDPKTLHWARQLLALDDSKSILIHPGVSQVSVHKGMVKRWPPDNWAQLIEALCLDEDNRVYLVGGPDDQQTILDIVTQLPSNISRFYNLYGQTRSLTDLAALIQCTHMMICLDSAPMHVAVALRKPLVAIFGETDPKRLLPDNGPYCALKSTEAHISTHQVQVNVNDVLASVNQLMKDLQVDSPSHSEYGSV